MWNKPTRKMLMKMPALYSQDKRSLSDRMVHLKFFIGGWTWYVLEVDKSNYDLMFALVYSPMASGGEYGYVSLRELSSVSVPPGVEVDRDTSVSPYEPVKLVALLKRDGMPLPRV